jgi:hypothetical protein
VSQLQGELEAARLAIVSLLAVMTDEQFRAVATALEAVEGMSDTAAAALDELRLARSRRKDARGDQMLTSLETLLATRDQQR